MMMEDSVTLMEKKDGTNWLHCCRNSFKDKPLGKISETGSKLFKFFGLNGALTASRQESTFENN